MSAGTRIKINVDVFCKKLKEKYRYDKDFAAAVGKNASYVSQVKKLGHIATAILPLMCEKLDTTEDELCISDDTPPKTEEKQGHFETYVIQELGEIKSMLKTIINELGI